MAANVIATSFSLVAFAAAIAVGIAAGNAADTVIWRAIFALLICWPVGRIVGGVAQRTVERNIEKYKEDNPIPEVESDDSFGPEGLIPESNVELIEES